MKQTYEPGQIFKVECPFIRKEENFIEGPMVWWQPGVEWDHDGYGNSWPSANGMGYVVYEVVAIVDLPKPYRRRIFYKRTWIDPDGKAFGKKDLKVCALSAFKGKLLRWERRTYDVEIVEPDLPSKAA